MGATISSAGDGGGIALKPPVRSAGFTLDEATLDGLEVSTYFDREEIVALYWAFNVTSNSEKFISKERFVEAFPSFTSPLVVDALFRAVGADGNCRIDFTCFLRALSVTCRGTPEEKLKLAFRVMDLDNNGVVSVEETRAVASEFGAILQSLGQSESRFGTPMKVVESIFKYQDAQEMDRMRSWMYKLKRRKALKQFERELAEEEKDQVAKNKTILSDMLRQAHGEGLSRWSVALQLVREKAKHEVDKMRRLKRKAIKRRKDDESAMMKSLTWKNFAKRAINDPNFYQCFGLFDYMHSIILAPIEARLNPDGQKPIEGILEVAYKGKISFGRPKLSKRYCVCNGQFLGIYSRHWDRRERPKRVVSLQYASIITTSAVKPAFRIVAPGFSGLFVAPSFSDRKEWVTAVRRNVPRVNPYASFAQPRVAVAARPLIDGKEYFGDLYSAICGARSRILITGWFFIPTLYLIRADPLNPNHRLDNLLLRKAKEGVHIYILIWNETRLAYPLNSGKIISYLENLHPRIRAIRHPGLFPLSWSHHQKSVVIDDVIAYVGGLDLAWGRYDDENYRLFDPDGQIWPSNDYSNLIISRTENGSLKPDSALDRSRMPRMPWHDVAVRIEGQAAWDAARNFIQRWNHARFTTNSVRRLTCPYLMPTDLPLPGVSFDFLDHHRSLDLSASAPISRAASLSSPSLPPPPPSPSCTVQVLRSISPWSAGVAVPEDSIYKAMIDLITHSKHFIYIENQYFISSTIGVSPVPRNKVALALLERLRRAIGLREKFRVVIVLPLFPAGNLTDLATRYVLKWVYTTVNRKGDSLLRLLEAEFPEVDVNNYISFFNLRTWGKLGDKYCTHQIYVHSKLLIVDDRYALIGSANINDRSLCGDRDSELSVLLSDSQHVATVMAGRPFTARKEVLQLRLRLWQRLLGLGSDAASLARLQDPVSDDVYLTLWRRRAECNSRIYRTVFAHIEDNTERLEDWKPLSWASEETADAAKPEEHTQCDPADCFSLSHIKGFVVEHTTILSASRLHPHIWEKEFFLQVDTFI